MSTAAGNSPRIRPRKESDTATVGSVGQVLSFITLESLLGTPGEQGEVWRAHANDLESLKFAVKIGKTPLTPKDKEAYSVFEDEFAMLAKMRHPCIVKVYWHGEFARGEAQYPLRHSGGTANGAGCEGVSDRRRREAAQAR